MFCTKFWPNSILILQMLLSKKSKVQLLTTTSYVTCLEGRFRINYPSTILEILKLPEWNEDSCKIFKNYEGYISQKSLEPQNNSVNGAMLITINRMIMLSNIYDDVTDIEVCEFPKNTKI